MLDIVNFKHPLVLASKSPRRQYLMRELGFKFDVQVKDVDESFYSDLEAEAIPLYLAKKKADAFKPEMKDDTLYITADTIVWKDSKALNKPESVQEAINMLTSLSGAVHQVYTGVCITSQVKTVSFFVRSNVIFRDLSKDEIVFYVENYKPFDKAGAYGAQETLPEQLLPCSAKEVAFLKHYKKEYLNNIHTKDEVLSGKTFPMIERIEGSYFNVMGLPIMELCTHLEQFTDAII